MDGKIKFAVLIDSENISAKYLPIIFDEIEKHGFASHRRIYGNWSKHSDWTEELFLQYSIVPIQQYNYVKGKNAIDITMVIDAMDLLYKNKVDGFCLVTSDSDFTRLAIRLREEEKFVLGMGESKTPISLTRACNKFIHLNLIDSTSKEDEVPICFHGKEAKDNVTELREVIETVRLIFSESGNETLDLSYVGDRLSKKFTDFDVRNYGYSKLSVFMENELQDFKVVKTKQKHLLVKEEAPKSKQIEGDIVEIILKNKGKIHNLSMINEELKKKYPSFDLKDYGYSRISSFLKSMGRFVVYQNTVCIAQNGQSGNNGQCLQNNGQNGRCS